MFALIDINSAFASCETVFRPDLYNKPVVVLSSNDGNIIARNKLAKSLGIKMGDPYFKLKGFLKKNNVAVFSSNYTLYHSFSQRFYNLIESVSPKTEIYSVDEVFSQIDNIDNVITFDIFGKELRELILRHTGLTVGIGIAPTKTLAKVCNHHAKKWDIFGGVVALNNPERIRRMLLKTDVEDVWGVGRRLTKKLALMGIKTAYDLAQSDTRLIRKSFGVVLERTVRELRGEVCFRLEENPPVKQQIVVSRSFGSRVTAFDEMQRAVCGYAVRAAAKLRSEKQYARIISVFIKSSPFAVNEPPYSNIATIKLTTATQDTRDIIEASQRALSRIWRDGIRYAKAGVMLDDFSGKETQFNLFDEYRPKPKSEQLMRVLDQLNACDGNHLFFAGEGIDNTFTMRRELLSPYYTTNWNDIPKAKVL